MTAWGNAFSFPALFSQNRMLEITMLGMTLIVGGLVIFYLARLHTPAKPQTQRASRADPPGSFEQRRWALQATGIGLVALLVCGWPWWVTDLRIDLTFPWNRFTQAMMLGVSLVLAPPARNRRRLRAAGLTADSPTAGGRGARGLRGPGSAIL